MSRQLRAGALCAAGLVLMLAARPALARGPCATGHGCGSCKCPPPLKWYSEGPPCIKFKCACPRPICDPCEMQHYGYFATCWRPWSFPADWSHCPSPPPGAVLPPPQYPPYSPRETGRPGGYHGGELPAPAPAVAPRAPGVQPTALMYR